MLPRLDSAAPAAPATPATPATPPSRHRRFLSLFRSSSARASTAPDPLPSSTALHAPPRKARLGLFAHRSSSSAATAAGPATLPPAAPSPSQAPAIAPVAPAMPSTASPPQPPPPRSRASFIRRPSVLSQRDRSAANLPERPKSALGIVTRPSVSAARNASPRDTYPPLVPDAAPRTPNPAVGPAPAHADGATRWRASLDRSASESRVPGLTPSATLLTAAHHGAQTHSDARPPTSLPSLACTTPTGDGQRDVLSPFLSAHAVPAPEGKGFRVTSGPLEHPAETHTDAAAYTPPQPASSEADDTHSPPPSSLFSSNLSCPLDQSSSCNVVSALVSDATSTRNSSHRGSIASSKATPPWAMKPPGPFAPGTVPTCENALPAAAWTTIEVALPKFHHATQRLEAGGHLFERAKLLRLVLQTFLRMEQERPLVRPDQSSAPSTPRSATTSLSEFSTGVPSPADSNRALSPLSPATSLSSVCPASSSSTTPKLRASEQAYQRYKDLGARSALLLDWTTGLLRSLRTAQSTSERMAMLESINMLLEARNLSTDALLAPEASVQRDRFDDTLFTSLEYAIHELNRKGVYHNNLVFAGHLLSLALIRLPGVAHKILSALPVSPLVLDRVSRGANWDQLRPTGLAWDDYLACFPASLRSICFDDSRSYLARVRARRPPQEPEEDTCAAAAAASAASAASATADLGLQPHASSIPTAGTTANLVEYKGRVIAMQGNWLRRFQSDDSEVIFSFLRNFHRLLERLVRTNLPAELHGFFFGAPGMAHVTAVIHQKGLSLVHRSITSVTRRQVPGAAFNPGETANVLLGSTSDKPQQLEAATTRCVSAVVDAVTFGEALSTCELQTRMFLPTIRWHVALLVTRTSLHDVQSVFCLFDWLDSLMDMLSKMRIPSVVVDVDFILHVLRRILLESDHTVTLIRTIAFCYTNFSLFMATSMHRHGLADNTLLALPIFTKLLLSWSPTVRAYFLHMLVFRFGHMTDFAPPPDDPHAHSTRHIILLLHSRLNDVRTHYARFCHEDGDASSGAFSACTPCDIDCDAIRPIISRSANDNDDENDDRDNGNIQRPSTPMLDMNRSKVLGLTPNPWPPSKSPTATPTLHAMSSAFSSGEHLDSNITFDLQSDTAHSHEHVPVRSHPHSHTRLQHTAASHAFLHRPTLVAGPASGVVLHDLPHYPFPTSDGNAFPRALQPYARQVLREYEQTVKEHDTFSADDILGGDEHAMNVPLLTVAWPAMWQGE